jgi:hypothetical protein
MSTTWKTKHGDQQITVQAISPEMRRLTCEGTKKTKSGKTVTTFFDRTMTRFECDATLQTMGVQK